MYANIIDPREMAYLTFKPRPDQPERYDQQESFYYSADTGVSFLIGGNGAGTSECSVAKVAKFILADCPPPRHDTPFWIIAESYQQVCDAVWKEKLFGHGHIPRSEIDWERVRWYKPNQNWPFEVPLKPWPGQPGRNWTLQFKSYKQGRAQMQAASIGGFLFVEQFPWGILEEVLRGCREYNYPGSKLCEFTPVDPMLSAPLEELIENDRLPEGWQIYRANTRCAVEAGHVSESWYNEFFGMVPMEMRQTREIGAFASFEGAIYQSFNPSIHLVGDSEIDFPIGCHHRRAIDWGSGPQNAFVCLWGYKNGWGQWSIYDEYWSTDQNFTINDHLMAIQDRHPWPGNNVHYGTTYADPSDPGNLRIAAKLSQYCPEYENMNITPANNRVLEGIDYVRWCLQTDPTYDRPRLLIHKHNCPNLSREMRTYRWERGSEAGLNPRDARPVPLKKDDHAVDACRYLLFSDSQKLGNVVKAYERPKVELERFGIQLQKRMK
jgi:phage terminase large subunit-like protein